ncbi:hypothetical protein JCGZ_19662 [Jatropha curcas]|uniref:Uncharacterized protein n=1 Tax=Jatropha curcas TaxID=180498 RepID=A0A067KAW9_JATCU|nr:hypothetical protein JCGZ_19662 [Jatropha curcas]
MIEDEEHKVESDKKEHIDDTWQDEEFFLKMMLTRKSEPELVMIEKFKKLGKKLEKLHVFMKSKGMDQYVYIDDDDDELKLKQTAHMIYKMPKVAKYDVMKNGWTKLRKHVKSDDEVVVHPVTLDVWSSEEEEEARAVNHMTQNGQIYQLDMIKPREEKENASSSDVIDILAVEPKALESGSEKEKKEEEKEPEEQGVEGPQALEEEKEKKEEGQAA